MRRSGDTTYHRSYKRSDLSQAGLDILLVEVGGTVGDIELCLLEAIRQVMSDGHDAVYASDLSALYCDQ